MIAYGLTVLLVAVHTALFAIDFLNAAPVADFLIRPDGSQMDPLNMLPLEEIFVAMIAFPFGIIMIAFISTNQRDAAWISFLVHMIYGIHQFWKRERWATIIHPNSALITIDFFIYSHLVWALVSAVIYILSDGELPVASAPIPKRSNVTRKPPTRGQGGAAIRPATRSSRASTAASAKKASTPTAKRAAVSKTVGESGVSEKSKTA